MAGANGMTRGGLRLRANCALTLELVRAMKLRNQHMREKGAGGKNGDSNQGLL